MIEHDLSSSAAAVTLTLTASPVVADNDAFTVAERCDLVGERREPALEAGLVGIGQLRGGNAFALGAQGATEPMEPMARRLVVLDTVYEQDLASMLRHWH